MRAHDTGDRDELPSRRRAEEAGARAADPPAMSPAALAQLQRSVGNRAVADMLAVQRAAVHGVLRTPGRPLDEQTRTDMESRLGADFSDVRLHDDATARNSAAELGARAYTSGNHVVIGEGGADEHTLIHELTHVVQQRHGPVAGTDTGQGFRLSDPSDRFEREAEDVATRAMADSSPAMAPEPPGHTHNGAAIQRTGSDTDMMEGITEEEMLMVAFADSDIEMMEGETERAEGVTETETDVMEGVTEQEKLMVAFAEETKLENYNRFIEALAVTLRAEDPPWYISNWKKEKGKRYEFKAFRPRKIDDDKFETNVVEPHPYDDQPETQALRWISTVVKVFLENGDKDLNLPRSDPKEVQAGLDGGKLILSANDQTSAELLAKVVSNGNDMPTLLARMAKENPKKPWPPRRGRPEAGPAIEERLRGHHTKLAAMIDENIDDYQAVLTAIRSVEVAVRGVPGLHAERRIHKHLGDRLPEVMAGTKRPCATCYMLLYPNHPDIRPGNFFGNYNSNLGLDEFDSTDPDVDSRARRVVDRLTAAGVTATWDTRLPLPGTDGHIDVEEVGSGSEDEEKTVAPSAR